MAAPLGSCRWALVAALGLAAVAPVRGAELLPLAVQGGRCECVLPTERPDEQFYLILGSLAQAAGPQRVAVRTETTTAPIVLPLEQPASDPLWQRRVRDLAEHLERLRHAPQSADTYPALEAPPRLKVFHLFTGEHDFQDPHCYTAVTAALRAVGRHCQVYVDCDHPDLEKLRPTIADAVRTFDEEVHPSARQTLGQVLDVDRDGRFTILFTGWLVRLQSGKVSLGGFVRGSDLYRDLDAPFGNRCDMMYLNTDLQPGPYLHALLAHEYTHAVVFSEHVFGNYLPGLGQHDEESWLSEALAHVVEDRHGWGNLDYRVGAFLSDPGRYRLVEADYYGSGLWRTPGIRGATYLFLRWCSDRYGPALLRRMVQSNLRGIDNLEVATGERFASLFREWSAALLLTGSGLEVEGVSPLRGLDPRQPLAGRLLCGPRCEEVPLAGGRQEVSLTGTSAAYLLLHSPAGARSRLTITAEPGAELQVSLVRLPAGSARLAVESEAVPGEPAVRVRLTAHGGDVTVKDVVWERLAPAGDTDDTSYRVETAAAERVRACLGEPRLKAGDTRTSTAISLPSAACVIKVAATDAAGHRLAGWAVIPARP